MFNQYPYLNLNDLNLDYILNAIKEMRYEVTNFVSINAIKYADPIQWNITSQYEKNTIVIDPVTGTAYISVAAVPSGVSLTRPEYWTVVFDLGSFVTRAAQNFTSHWESETTTTATFPTSAGGWIVWGDVLYKAVTNITAGDTYVVGGNIEHFTIEDLYNAYLNTIAQILAMIGDLTDLNTADKTSVVNAINEVVANLAQEIIDRGNADGAIDAKIGNLANLTTPDKSSIVNAINSLDLSLEKYSIYNVVDYGAKGDGVTDDTSAIQACIDDCANNGGGVVYFPIGVYELSATLTIDHSCITILGASKYGTILRRNTNYGNTITVKGTNQLTSIFIENMFLFHRITNVAMTGVHILMENVAQGAIKDVYTENGYGAIDLGGTVDIQISNCILVGRSSSTLGHNGYFGIRLRNENTAATPLATQTKIYGTRIFGPRVAGFQNGVLIMGAEETEITNCYIGNNRYHNIHLQQRLHIILETVVMGCYLDGCNSHSIYFDGNGGDNNLYIGNTTIIGNNLKGQSRDGTFGIFADDADRGGNYPTATKGLNIIGNTISGLQSHAMYLLGGDDFVIVGNKISGVGGYGIIIGAKVSNAIVNGNICGSGSPYNGASDSTNGISCAVGAEYINITNNNVEHNTTPIAISANTLGQYNNRVSNNIGFPKQSAIAPTMPESGVTLKNPYGCGAFVSIYGGTDVTDIKLNGVTIATSLPIMFEVGAIDEITLTYTGAPTWAWFRQY